MKRTDEAVAVTHPMLVLWAHALVMLLGTFSGSPDVAIVGIVLRLSDCDPLLFVGQIDLVDTGLVLVYFG